MKKVLGTLLAILLLVPIAPAQESPADKPARSAYRLEFAFFELEGGKRTNQRDYSMVVLDDNRGSIKSGTRMPLQGEKGPIYMDVGLSIQCRLIPRHDKVHAEIDLDFNSLASPEQTSSATPLLRHNNQHVSTILTVGKPMLLTSIEDITSNKRIQVEMKVTKLE